MLHIGNYANMARSVAVGFFFASVLFISGAKADPPPPLLIEDAEDGSISRWILIRKQCQGTEDIQNVESDAAHGRVLKFCGWTPDARFMHYPLPTSNRFLSWDMKTATNFIFYVVVNTNQGPQALRYVGGMPDKANNAREYIDIGSAARSGQWVTIERDLASDLRAEYGDDREYLGIVRLMVAGGMELDNITARAAGPSSAISGRVLDLAGNPLPGAPVEIRSSETILYRDYADANGRYGFGSLVPGTYTVSTRVPHYFFSGVTRTILEEESAGVDLVEAALGTITLEDGEHGLASGWRVLQDGCAGNADIQNVSVGGDEGRIIRLCGMNTAPLYAFDAYSDTNLGKASHRFLEMKIKASSVFNIVVSVETNLGIRALRYTARMPRASHPAAHELIDIDERMMDGTWKTFTRDLESDVSAMYGGDIEYRGLQYIYVRGGMEIDTIRLLEEGMDGFVHNFVYDDTGNPVNRATVTLYDDDETYIDITNEQGEYAFTSLTPSAEYTLAIGGPAIAFRSSTVFASNASGSGSDALTEQDRARIRAACNYSYSPIPSSQWYDDMHVHVNPDHNPADVMEALKQNGIRRALLWPNHPGDGGNAGVIESNRRLDHLYLDAAGECSRMLWAVAVHPDEPGQADYLQSLSLEFPERIAAVSVDLYHSNRPIQNDITSQEMTNVLDFARNHELPVDLQASVFGALMQNPESTIEDDLYARLAAYPSVKFTTFAFSREGVQNFQRFLELPNLYFNRIAGYVNQPIPEGDVREYVETMPSERSRIFLFKSGFGTDATLSNSSGSPTIESGASGARSQRGQFDAAEEAAAISLYTQLEAQYQSQGYTQAETENILSSDPRFQRSLGDRLATGAFSEIFGAYLGFAP